ncbi:MAG: hypothetical protein ACREQV_11180, partial [Candidatus Binatia bacterium]
MLNSAFGNLRALIVGSMTIAVALVVHFPAVAAAAQSGHEAMQGMDMPMKHSEKMPPRSELKPAQGASVKIVSPKSGQVIKGDAVALEFQIKKGKVGEHVHAYVDGEMAGMFKGSKGTLNGLKPGKHTIELRVATSDHKTELDATDK